MKKAITNTAKSEVNPQWLFGKNPDRILDQEAKGQSQLVESFDLPTDIKDDDRKQLEAMGVEFGEPHSSDPLFCRAKLPEGWKKEATEHSMWSKLTDAEGNQIAMIFYKAAFYDRSAFLRLTLGE